MRKLALATAIVLAAAMPGAFHPDQAFAVAGCCKKRASTTAGWSDNHRDLKLCRDENRHDGDNVFDERGLVWWDVRC